MNILKLSNPVWSESILNMQWHLECDEIRENYERKDGIVEKHTKALWKCRLTEEKYSNNNF